MIFPDLISQGYHGKSLFVNHRTGLELVGKDLRFPMVDQILLFHIKREKFPVVLLVKVAEGHNLSLIPRETWINGCHQKKADFSIHEIFLLNLHS